MDEALSKAYDELYTAATDICKRADPCRIVKLPNGEVECAKSRRNPNFQGGCCGGCEHLGPNGCTVDALGCRVSACTDLFRSSAMGAGWPEEVIDDLAALQRKARNLGVPMIWRASKAQSFQHMATTGKKVGWLR